MAIVEPGAQPGFC